MSSYTKVSCGVPQGSCLGPLLFLLYINDVSLISNFNTTLFADDTCLMMADNNLKNLEHKVQIELKKVNSWLCQNKLFLNFSKTNYMIINRQPLKTCRCNFKIALNGITINRAHAVKYLGLFIDDNLKWTSQINYLFTQLARGTGLPTDCVILFQEKPFACFTIVLYTAEFNMELLRRQQQIKLHKK